ncbi:hypothetical protein EIN_111920 [Entamoeba invadens IP1]|uniref:Uncharacterized protein n=1 Tax=Entamoeba invadens IP1 TaxID=370355 RepID=A0A0A1TXW3_ENTIV|nr:hypothetical protein EIN_111920 [Entamoeba invadens IP1]ELP86238.1 hypothetical protein EIN_111920 [Entamoeba invadens IP1]|eukprot:XP_004185584.1 hypothetical protein EIN_111920 [Entamoeba invadens IP1]
MANQPLLTPKLIIKNDDYRSIEKDVKVVNEQKAFIKKLWGLHVNKYYKDGYDLNTYVSPECQQEEVALQNLFANVDELLALSCRNNQTLLSRYGYINNRFVLTLEGESNVQNITNVIQKYIGIENIFKIEVEVVPNKDITHQLTKLHLILKDMRTVKKLKNLITLFHWNFAYESCYENLFSEAKLTKMHMNRKSQFVLEQTQENLDFVYTDLYEKIEEYVKNKKMTDKIIKVICFTENTFAKMFVFMFKQDFETTIDGIKKEILKSTYWVE